MEFSQNGMHLLSGSRDRSFCIFRKVERDSQPGFQLLHRVVKAHSRIIWGIAWAPVGDIFATGKIATGKMQETCTNMCHIRCGPLNACLESSSDSSSINCAWSRLCANLWGVIKTSVSYGRFALKIRWSCTS